jgi:hypothetical protein
MREEVARGCRRLHNEELHDLYASPNTKYYSGNQIEEDGMDGPCNMHGRDEKCI